MKSPKLTEWGCEQSAGDIKRARALDLLMYDMLRFGEEKKGPDQ
jgi:hypothetical protein